jgi:hypothetical protein
MGRSEKQDVGSSNNLKISMNKGDPIPQNLSGLHWTQRKYEKV